MTQPGEVPAEGIEQIRKQGLSLRERGEHGRALALFATLGARWPHDGRNHIDRAVCLNAMGRLAEAIAVLTQALDAACADGGWHKPCLLHLARFHQQAGDAAVAERYIQLCLAKWPNDVAVLLDAATQAAQAGRRDVARQHHARAEALVSRQPGHASQATTITALATFEWAYGDADRAVAIMAAWCARRSDPDGVRRLIFFLARLGRGDEAFEQLHAAYARDSLSPDEEKSFTLHIQLLRQFGHFPEAVLLAESHLAKRPQSETLHRLLAELYLQALRPAAAATVLAQSPTDSHPLTRAIVDRQLGRMENARAGIAACAANTSLDKSSRSEALRQMFYSKLFALDFDAAREVLANKIALAPEQYLNALHRDQLELFMRHQGSVWRVVAADGGAALCAAQLQMEQAEGHEAICCSAWLFLGKIAAARRWHDITMRDVFNTGQGPSRIPRHIVQYWDQSDIPGDVQGAMRSWRRHYPEFGYAVLDGAAARRFIAENHSPALAARFEQAAHPAMRSDIFRMAWLLRKGGYYIDADEGCAGRSAIFSLDAGLVLPLVVANEYEVQNNFIGATPDHPLISAFLANICMIPEDQFAGGLVWWLTGPGHMCRLIARHVAATLLGPTNENMAQFHEILSSDVILLPKPVQDTAMFEPKLAYKSTALSWQRARAHEKIGGAVPAPPNPPALFEAHPKT